MEKCIRSILKSLCDCTIHIKLKEKFYKNFVRPTEDVGVA